MWVFGKTKKVEKFSLNCPFTNLKKKIKSPLMLLEYNDGRSSDIKLS